jgi:hypothetical protein
MGVTHNSKDLLENRSSVQVPLVAGGFLEGENPRIKVFPLLLLLKEFT